MNSTSTRMRRATAEGVVRAATWALALAGVGGLLSLGALAVANTLTTLPSPHDAQLGRLVDPLSATDAAPVELAVLTVDEDADAPAAAVPPTPPRPPMPPAADVTMAPVPAPRAAAPAAADRPAAPAKLKAATVKPAKPAAPTVLSDAQITALKRRLRLSPGQETYWPEIEASLRGVARQINEANRRAHGAAPVDMNTPEIERLKSAAMPFLMQMRPDQRAEIVALARIMGMEQMVAML